MEEKKRCPWCQEEVSIEESLHQGSNGKMRLKRCSKCGKLVSARLEGEPDRILKKELITGDAL